MNVKVWAYVANLKKEKMLFANNTTDNTGHLFSRWIIYV